MTQPVLKKSHDQMLAGGSGLLAYLILYAAMPGADGRPQGKLNLDDFRKNW